MKNGLLIIFEPKQSGGGIGCLGFIFIAFIIISLFIFLAEGAVETIDSSNYNDDNYYNSAQQNEYFSPDEKNTYKLRFSIQSYMKELYNQGYSIHQIKKDLKENGYGKYKRKDIKQMLEN